LVPRGNKPISPERDRERPTDDESEVARPSGCDQPWIGISGQLLKDVYRTLTGIGQRPAQRHRIEAAHMPLAHTVEVCTRQSVCMSEHVFVGHRRNSLSRPQRYSASRTHRPPNDDWRVCVGSLDVSTVEDPGYALSSSSGDEHERLARQADMYAPFTRRLLLRAGIEPGMRVLDVGCGPGDVSFLLSELVGTGGSVVGVERDEQALARAHQRTSESELTNIEFVCGDFRDIELAGDPFDALVGRLVLMYQGDPPAAVRAAAHHVRPGGVVVFAEMCMRTGSVIPQRFLVSWPHTPASEQLSKWIDSAFGGLGTQPDMGMRLPATFAEAGLEPCLDLDSEVAIAVGEEAVSEPVDLARSLLPAILAAGVATEEEVDIDTLAERLRADTGPAGRISIWPTVIGAYARKPQ
jgi:SAM-dependent methyltransferase